MTFRQKKGPVSSGGFTIVEIMVVVSVLGLLLVMAIPYYQKVQERSSTETCKYHLQKIDDAKSQWAMEVSAEPDAEKAGGAGGAGEDGRPENPPPGRPGTSLQLAS